MNHVIQSPEGGEGLRRSRGADVLGRAALASLIGINNRYLLFHDFLRSRSPQVIPFLLTSSVPDLQTITYLTHHPVLI